MSDQDYDVALEVAEANEVVAGDHFVVLEGGGAVDVHIVEHQWKHEPNNIINDIYRVHQQQKVKHHPR